MYTLRLLMTGNHTVEARMIKAAVTAYQEDPAAFGRNVHEVLRSQALYMVESIWTGERSYVRSEHVVGWEVLKD